MTKSNKPAPPSRIPEKNNSGVVPSWLTNPAQLLSSRSFQYALVIVVVTLLAFFPALRSGFMQTWDDEKYVTANPVVRELTPAHLGQMFTRPVNGSYVPLPLLSFAIDYKLFGDNPLPFHATNLILHILCALLVYRILRMLKIDALYALFGALLFGIHPMRVESVAWISERKDVLYSLFYLSAIITYIRYITGSPREPRFLLYSILLFAASLLSKIEAVTLPLSLLLVDFLLQRPLRLKLLTEKIPYFILSLLFGALGLYIIHRIGLHSPDFLKGEQSLGFANRFFYGLFAVTGYLFKFVIPWPQSVIYPYPAMTGITLVWIRFVNPAVIALLAILVWRSLRKSRAVAFGMLFFLVNVLFLLQIFAPGAEFFADRYTYIPYLGLMFIVVWFAGKVVEKNSSLKTLVLGILTAYLAVCMVMTYTRARVWNDGVSLWSDVISQYPGMKMEPYVNRGIAYTLNRDWDRALEDFSMALSIGPPSAGVYADRGMVYGFVNQPEKALADFSGAIGLDPKNVKALFNRGVTYSNMGQNREAIADFRKVIVMEPSYAAAYAALATLLMEEKKYDTCLVLAEQGIRLEPDRPELYAVLGNCEFETGQTDKAVENFRHCLRIDNANLDAFLGLAAAFVARDDMENARRNLGFAIEAAQQKNINLSGVADIEKAGISLPGKKKEALIRLQSHK
ncbi:MAG: tetratricopeptide repeat protein [Bacteroidota bacterium]